MKKFYAVLAVVILCVLVAIALPALRAQGTNNGIHGAFNGPIYLSGAYSMIFGDNTSTDVSLSKGAANTLALGPAGAHIGFTASNKDVSGICTLGTNCVITFVNPYAATPSCVATDTTGANAVKAVTSGGPPVTTLTITGTSTDVIAYHCLAVTN